MTTEAEQDHSVTFELAPGLDPRTFGATVALRNGESYDIAYHLADGDGQIVTDDEHLIVALDVHEAVVREGFKPAERTAKEIIAAAPDFTAAEAVEALAAEQDGEARVTVINALTKRVEEVNAAEAEAAQAEADRVKAEQAEADEAAAAADENGD